MCRLSCDNYSDFLTCNWQAGHFYVWPDLVEGVAVIKGAVFDDVTDLTAVVDVIERVLVEDDQVGDLADLDGAVLSMGNS